MSEESIIQLKQAVIKQRDNIILKDVNIDIKQGEFIYLIGRVGSGKSSLLKTLYGEIPLQFGLGNIVGFSLNKIKRKQKALLRRKLGIVFQDFRLLSDRNVHDNLLFVLKATRWKNKKAIEDRISNVLEKVDMTKKGYKMPHELSGGEQQRIVIARALLNSPEVILADEPTGNIDPETSYQLTELLRDLSDSGKTVIIVTHQYDLIERYPGIVYKCEDSNVKKYEGNIKSVTKSVNNTEEIINIELID